MKEDEAYMLNILRCQIHSKAGKGEVIARYDSDNALFLSTYNQEEDKAVVEVCIKTGRQVEQFIYIYSKEIGKQIEGFWDLAIGDREKAIFSKFQHELISCKSKVWQDNTTTEVRTITCNICHKETDITDCCDNICYRCSGLEDED